MSGTAANALELTVVEALSLGHNYVGCEHLLLGLVAEPDGTAGQVLRGLGAEQRTVRQVVSAASPGTCTCRRPGGRRASPPRWAGAGTGVATAGPAGGESRPA